MGPVVVIFEYTMSEFFSHAYSQILAVGYVAYNMHCTLIYMKPWHTKDMKAVEYSSCSLN